MIVPRFFIVAVIVIVLLEFSSGKVKGPRSSDQSRSRKLTEAEEKEQNEKVKEFIKQVDTEGVLRKLIRRKMYIPEDSSLTFTSQVSRPNIFPNIFNQGEGFIVDAVIEWPIWLDLHKFANAMYEVTEEELGGIGEGRDEFEEDGGEVDEYIDHDHLDDEDVFSGKAMKEIIGVERCLIYDKVEMAISMYLEVSRNTSKDCVLRAVCEANVIADYYPDAPSSVFFEFLHLILKPSLGTNDVCYGDYVTAEKAAYKAPQRCSEYVSRCPLNIAGLFLRNFFPGFV